MNLMHCLDRAPSPIVLAMFGICSIAGAFASPAISSESDANVRTTNMRISPDWKDDHHLSFSREAENGDIEIVSVDSRSGTMTVEPVGLTEDDASAGKAKSKRSGFKGGVPPNSGPSDDETEIKFINRTYQKVQLFWVDSSGDRIGYRKMAAGETYRQHTYAGHVWEAVGDDGAYYGSIVAELPTTAAEIKTKFARPQKKSSRRQSQPGLDEGVEAELKHLRNALRKAGDGSLSLVDGTVSPDGRVLAAWKKTDGDRSLVFTIESSPTGGGRAKLKQRPYALPGDAMDQFELVLWDIEQQSILPIEMPIIDFGYPAIRWKDQNQLLVEKVDRGHQRFRLFLIDPMKGEVTTPIDETSTTFIWTAHGPMISLVTYLKDESKVIYASEKSGYRHLYLVDLNGDLPMIAITAGDYLVRKIVHVDEEQGVLDLMVGEFHDDQDPYHQHLIRVGINDGKVVSITQGDGNHEVQFSPDRSYVIGTYSRVDAPPIHELRRMEDGHLIATLAEAKRVCDSGTPYSLPTRFVAKGRDGETDIWGTICFPADFDKGSNQKYPVIEAIYAGPHGSHVPKSYRSSPTSADLTSLGFVVVRIDGMGTANRSKAFHDHCWHNLKDAGFPDRIAWMRAAAEKYPGMDLTRVGIFGTSAGGQNACGALLFYGDFYKVAVASCGCHDNRMDKASWNEQWMGYPVGPHYSESSNIDNASKLKGDLLLLVGELDENVPPESTLRLVDALIKANKQFRYLMIPGMGHSDGGTYGRELTRQFFAEKLRP